MTAHPRLRAFALAALLPLTGCTDDSKGIGSTGPRAVLLLIQGEMSRQSQSIRLTLGGEPVNGATVTVNGEAAVQAAPGEPYVVELATQAGSEGLTLSVKVGPIEYTATGDVPTTPVITDVGGGYGVAERVWLTWTSATDPDRFAVSAVRCWQNVSPTYSTTDIAGHKREFTFPVALYSEHFLYLAGYSNGTFTGPVHPASRMNIQGPRDLAILGYC